MSMVENPYPLGGDFAEAWGEGAAAERERIVKALRDHAESFAGSPYKLNAAAYRMAADHIEGTRFDADERSAPSPSPPEPAPDEPACTCARRDPDDLAAGYEMCPAHAVAAVREAAAPSPPEPAPDEQFRYAALICAEALSGKVAAQDVLFAAIDKVKAAAPSPPEPKCRAPHCWAEYGTPCADCPAAPSPPDTDDEPWTTADTIRARGTAAKLAAARDGLTRSLRSSSPDEEGTT